MDEVKTGRDMVQALMENTDDLDGVVRAVVRERMIRTGMARTGEGREIVAESLDALESMDQEAVLDLTDGEPTTLVGALRRYLDELEKRDPDGDELIPTARVGAELAMILGYPWSHEEERLAAHGVNSSVRLTLETRDDRDLSVKLGGHELARVSWEEAGSGGILAAEEVAQAVHRSVLARVIADRDHHVQLNSSDRRSLLAWLERPSGSWHSDGPSRVTVDAVEGGGILVRTRPYSYQHAHVTEARYLRGGA
jgi:hypothetical protein